jgi:hypothetical protein
LSRFDIAGGSVTGRSHALAGRCNQDAYAFRAEGDCLVAAVCDGCGSGAHSEVGAQLGARLVTAILLRRLAGGAAIAEVSWDAVRGEVLDALRPAAVAAGEPMAATVSDLLLFTIVGVAISGDEGVVFAAGDGMVLVDGEAHQLGPFPGNAPPYIGYGLLDGAQAPAITIVRTFAANEVGHVLVGTDGVAALTEVEGGRLLRELWENDRHFTNRDVLRRTLALHNREEARPIWAERRFDRKRGSFEDDATVVVIRRR